MNGLWACSTAFRIAATAPGHNVGGGRPDTQEIFSGHLGAKLRKVTVEKFVDGHSEASYWVPCVLVDAAEKMLPENALDTLREKGIDLAAVAAACRDGERYSQSSEVVEKGIRKVVVVSCGA